MYILYALWFDYRDLYRQLLRTVIVPVEEIPACLGQNYMNSDVRTYANPSSVVESQP